MIRICIFSMFTFAAAVATADNPIHLSVGPQLFIDDYLIASQSGLNRRINSPAPVSQNPLVTGSGDQNVSPYLSVLRDPATGRFRMWYDAAANGSNHLAYMESADGITWVRPHQMLADPGNVRWGASVIDDGPSYPNPATRYKFAWWADDPKNPDDQSQWGMRIATSPDGLAWTSIASAPVLQKAGDILSIFYNPLHQHYIVSTSTREDAISGYGNLRIPIQSVSSDLVHWSAPTPVITPDSRDLGVTQFYGMAGVVARGNLLIANLKVLRDDVTAEGAPAGAYGVGYSVLAWSRDGANWTRDTQPFIDRNHTPGTWDHAMAWGDAQVVVGDQTYIYYGGYAWGHKVSATTDRQIGLAVMGRDRYVSRDAGTANGTLVTPVFVSDANDITINALVNGALTVRVLDQNGQPLPGFGWTDFSTIHGDSVSHAARWARAFSTLKGTPIELEFYLTNGQLYGFDLIPVPEPSMFVLVSTGLLGLLAYVWRRRK